MPQRLPGRVPAGGRNRRRRPPGKQERSEDDRDGGKRLDPSVSIHGAKAAPYHGRPKRPSCTCTVTHWPIFTLLYVSASTSKFCVPLGSAKDALVSTRVRASR